MTLTPALLRDLRILSGMCVEPDCRGSLSYNEKQAGHRHCKRCRAKIIEHEPLPGRSALARANKGGGDAN